MARFLLTKYSGGYTRIPVDQEDAVRKERVILFLLALTFIAASAYVGSHPTLEVRAWLYDTGNSGDFLFAQSTLADGKPDVSRRPLSQLTRTPPPGDPYPEIEILPGFGSFTYHDDGDNANRPVPVYYYRPDSFPTSDSKVIFTMHGSERDAVSARDRIVPYADRYNALLIAPEFSTDYYPDADDYLRGFVKDGGGTGNLRARSDWTFLTIEELFDIVLVEIPGAPSKYSIQGNSGGGQFICRIPLIVPEARFEVAAHSNSGWYTLPMRDELYPNGIGDLDITDAQIEQAYSKKVVVTVGELDTCQHSYNLEHNEFTDAQGLNRYERALFYHRYMGTDAAARGVPFNWDLMVVENVEHAAALMAHATAGAVFAGATTPPDVTLSPLDDTYIDESNPSEVYGASLELRVDGGNQEIAFFKFDLSSVSQPVDVAMLKFYITNGSDGQQFVHEVADNSWTESTLTWNNAPALGQEIGMTTGGEREGILYVEVTDYINRKVGGLASLALQSEDTDQLYFSSKEASYFPAQLDLFEAGGVGVEVVSFSAFGTQDGIEVRWTAEGEVGNCQWLIERATGKANGYELIASVPGAGPNPHPLDYSYTDRLVQEGMVYYYRLGDVDQNGRVTWHGPVSARFGGLANASIILQLAPNPCTSSGGVVISYQVPVETKLQLGIYDIAGRLVRTLAKEERGLCAHKAKWDGRDDSAHKVPSGVYFCRLTAGSLTDTKKLTLLR